MTTSSEDSRVVVEITKDGVGRLYNVRTSNGMWTAK